MNHILLAQCAYSCCTVKGKPLVEKLKLEEIHFSEVNLLYVRVTF